MPIKIPFAILAALSCFSASSALARDSLHYVCAGYEDPSQPGPDNYGFAIIYDEARGATVQDGGLAVQTRTQTLSTVWAGAFYQAHILERDFDHGTVALADPSRKDKIFFSGTFQFIESDSGGATMRLKGKLYTNPGDGSIAPDPISTMLKCANISN